MNQYERAPSVLNSDSGSDDEAKRQEANKPSAKRSPPIGRRLVIAFILFSAGLWGLYGNHWRTGHEDAIFVAGAICCACALTLIGLTGYPSTWGWWL